MMPRERFLAGIQPYQDEVLSDFDLGINRFYMLEWPRRHRKTTLALNLLVREAFRWPKTVWLYVAPTKVECREIVWDDPNMLREALPDTMGWKLNEQMMIVKFDNGSVIRFGGGDDPDSLRGPDYAGIVFDEWALHQERCWTEILRPVIAGRPPYDQWSTCWEEIVKPIHDNTPLYDGMRRWAMFLYTPKGINHATRMFDKACKGKLPDVGAAPDCVPMWFVSRLDAEMVGFMSPAELKLAQEDMPKQMYDQEFRCSRTTDEERCLITSAMLENLKDINWDARMVQRFEIRKIISIDPAFGGDQCVIMGIEDGRIMETKSLQPNRTPEIVLEAKRMAVSLRTRNFVGDCIGYGKGVMDELAADEAGYSVQLFNSSEESTDPLCINRRAEAYFFASGQIESRNAAPIMDLELRRQLPVASRYFVRGKGKILIQPKDIIKKELGCSPDIADAYTMGMWGLYRSCLEVISVHGEAKRSRYSHDRIMRMSA